MERQPGRPIACWRCGGAVCSSKDLATRRPMSSHAGPAESRAVACSGRVLNPTTRDLAVNLARIAFVTALLNLAILALPASAVAQFGEVRGTVRDSASGAPVSGAVVLTLDAIGTTLSRTITGERGQYRLPRPEAAMLVRAIRLGFRPTTERLPLLRADVITVDFLLATVPRTLDAMEVTAARGCPARADKSEAYALLDQARAGLLATVVAREKQPARLQVLRFERFLDLDGIEIERQTVRVDSSLNATTSFNAVQSAVNFVDRGFRSGSPGQYTYYGPDADVLLDERFQRGYCFSLAAADTTRRAQVGLRFSTASHRDGRVDIDGTLWIDTAARALHDIVFHYVGVEALAESFNAGGRVGFRTLPSGVPFIDQWSLHLLGAPDTLVSNTGLSAQVYAVREIGGELARARWADGQTWNGPQSTVQVTAVNRNGEPAVGAQLNLVGTDYRVVTDKSGRATFEGILPGPYTVAVDEPRFEQIALQIPTGRAFVAGRASSMLLRVTVPSAEQYMGTMCDRDEPRPDDAWLLARIVGGDGRPAVGAKWRVSEADGSRWRVVADNGIVGADGLVRLCRGLTRNTSVELAAWRDPKDAVRVQRIVDGGLTVLRVPLPALATIARAPAATPTSASSPALTVTGTVMDSINGTAVADARVTFIGTPYEGATDSSGRFIIGGIAGGDHVVEVSTPWLDSIGAVSRRSVTLVQSSAPLTLYLPTMATIFASACGAADGGGYISGRVSSATTTAVSGLRVVAEWSARTRDSTLASDARAIPSGADAARQWMEAPVTSGGTFRLCGLPINTRIVLRTEADTAGVWGSLPMSVQLSSERPLARADLHLDPALVVLSSFSGTVVADSTGVPIDNAEVTLTDIARTVHTDRRGAFRMTDVPPGPHLLSIKRVGFAPTMTAVDLSRQSTVWPRILLVRANTLAAVTVSADGIPTEFEERRAVGVGRYLTRKELDKQPGRRLGDLLTQVPGFGTAAGGAGHKWLVGKRAPMHLLPNLSVPTAQNPRPTACGSVIPTKPGQPALCNFSTDDLRNQGYYCATDTEVRQGMPSCACYTQVYLDGRLLNTERPTEPFDANTLPLDDIAGVELYASAASTPGRYSSPNAICGVMLVWTRRRRRAGRPRARRRASASSR